MNRGSLDGQALCNVIRLQEGRSFATDGNIELEGLSMGVVVDIEGGGRLPEEMSGANNLLGEGKADLSVDGAASRLGIMTSVRVEQTIS